ncbi:MAG: sensor histidine kinase [Nocardioides sp.]
MIFESGRSIVRHLSDLLPRSRGPQENDAIGSTTAAVGWPDEITVAELQLITDSVVDLAGFALAVITVVTVEGRLSPVAITGRDDVVADVKAMSHTVELVQRRISLADDLGVFRFVPHDRLDGDEEVNAWVPDHAPQSGSDAWLPFDLLFAPLYDDAGALCATLHVDMPVDGRRPTPSRRRILERYADQAGRVLSTARHRAALSEQIRITEAAREVVRMASNHLSMDAVLRDISDPLMDSFGLVGLWVVLFGSEHNGPTYLHAFAGVSVPHDTLMVKLARRYVPLLWQEQAVLIIDSDGTNVGHPDGLEDLQQRAVASVQLYLTEHAFGSVLLAPLGAGPDAMGLMVMLRDAHSAAWSALESDTVGDIGRDLGRIMVNAQAFEREQRSVRQLQDLDSFKNQLIATVSHELKNPLTSILGNLEMLEESVTDAYGERALGALDRSAQRMVRVVDDLLLLSKFGDPDYPVDARPVDLLPLVREVCDLATSAAVHNDLVIEVKAPHRPAIALGDPAELDRVLLNLISNAVKYCVGSGRVVVSLEREGDEVVLDVADNGIGISKDDQDRLFTEFFRSTNPEALRQPGTGLGLAIVDRIVRRHRGRIAVESDLGHGSNFRVFLPAAEDTVEI